jgi:hypothetical protein
MPFKGEGGQQRQQQQQQRQQQQRQQQQHGSRPLYSCFFLSFFLDSEPAAHSLDAVLELLPHPRELRRDRIRVQLGLLGDLDLCMHERTTHVLGVVLRVTVSQLLNF